MDTNITAYKLQLTVSDLVISDITRASLISDWYRRLFRKTSHTSNRRIEVSKYKQRINGHC